MPYLGEPHVVVAAIWVDKAAANHSSKGTTRHPAAHTTSTGLHHVRVLLGCLYGRQMQVQVNKGGQESLAVMACVWLGVCISSPMVVFVFNLDK